MTVWVKIIKSIEQYTMLNWAKKNIFVDLGSRISYFSEPLFSFCYWLFTQYPVQCMTDILATCMLVNEHPIIFRVEPTFG